MAITVLVADGFPVIRRGIQTWLAKHSEFEILGEAGNELEIVRMLKQSPPEVLVLDWHIPSGHGTRVLEQTLDLAPEMRVVITARDPREEQVVEALRGGAVAFIHKNATEEIVVDSVRAAALEEYYLGPPFSMRQLNEFLAKAQEPPRDPLATLTPRESEVLHLVAQGHTSAAIARRLHISMRTVEMHRARMMRKLHLANQLDFIRFAVQRGLLSLDDG